MKVFVKLNSTKPAKENMVNYIHVFEGHMAEDDSCMVVAEKSLIRIGRPKVFFTPPGEELFYGSSKQRDYQEVQEEIISAIFEGYIDIGQVVVHG